MSVMDKLDKILKTLKNIDERLKKLEQERVPRTFPSVMPGFSPGFWDPTSCPFGGPHEYPTIWHGTTPPPCNRCGSIQQQVDTFSTSSLINNNEESSQDT